MRDTLLPRISVVIPTYNQGRFIEQTITSILGQNYSNIELIIVDGGSTDTTTKIVNQYLDSIAHFISEPDTGQANAINKGFRLATGDIFAWLNSDDMYMPCTLTKVAEVLYDYHKPQLVYGGCLHFYQGKPNTFGTLPPTFDREILSHIDYIVQPSTFWTRSLWEATGELNESYHYVLDWDWFIRASKICEFIPVQDYLSIYRIHSEHKSSTGGLKRMQEIMHIIETNADTRWAMAYQDSLKNAAMIRQVYKILRRLHLYRFRSWFMPHLVLQHGFTRFETATKDLGLTDQ